MKPWMLIASAALAFGCSSEPQGNPDIASEPAPSKFGQLSLDLIGTDLQGQAYRLRNASFAITSYYYYYPPYYGGDDGGANTQVVSTETDPDASSITTRLLPGDYYVTLQDTDWYLEKVLPHGSQRVEEAVLLSSSTQYAYVYDRGSTNVAFRFGVDGKLIDFRHGDLKIDVEIEHPGDNDIDAGTSVADGG